jgi:multidrug resistance efflux pump
LGLSVLIAAAAGGYAWWQQPRSAQSTDNA